MHPRIVLLILLAPLPASCKSVDCGDGTTERDGHCVPATETVATALCGPFTELHGNQCEPVFPPTQCDLATTEPDVDEMGVTTCVGTGAGGCAAKLACPAPTSGKQTICGQFYDFETNQPFAQPGAMGAACTAGATTGPCSLGIKAFDAVAFASNPLGTAPLTTGAVYIDDCGRYKVPEITLPAGPFVALATAGSGGTTNPVGVATPKGANTATKDFEAFIVRKATTDGWGTTPSLGAGIYAAVYRGHRTGSDLVAGVTLTIAPMSNPTAMTSDPTRDFYFVAGSTNRTTLDGAAGASSTRDNGTALLSGANLGEVYSGAGGGLPASCIWEVHAGAALPGAVFIQIFRPTNAPSMTCPL